MNNFLSPFGGTDMLVQKNSEKLLALNDMTETCGLSLTPAQARALAAEEQHVLATHGRIALRSILPSVVEAFFDSPYLQDYQDTLALLCDTFYALKNEADNTWEDETLLGVMREAFDNIAHGDLDYMAEVTLGELERMLRRS